jgi:hypothetical protein
LRIFLSLILLFSFISAYSQGGNYISPRGSHCIADYYRRQELITGTPSPTSLLQQNYLHQFQLLDSLLPFPDSIFLFKGIFRLKIHTFKFFLFQ